LQEHGEELGLHAARHRSRKTLLGEDARKLGCGGDTGLTLRWPASVRARNEHNRLACE